MRGRHSFFLSPFLPDVRNGITDDLTLIAAGRGGGQSIAASAYRVVLNLFLKLSTFSFWYIHNILPDNRLQSTDVNVDANMRVLDKECEKYVQSLIN